MKWRHLNSEFTCPLCSKTISRIRDISSTEANFRDRLLRTCHWHIGPDGGGISASPSGHISVVLRVIAAGDSEEHVVMNLIKGKTTNQKSTRLRIITLAITITTVSYTHLTLPTIYSV